ncbi:hypothetical protein O988_04820 [Pseudogymnoascus sp. VKM F-3808]|nr:hypothetical protein O988_04820 [Pseudogymnoascus sp. VKM F-3808]
MDSLPQLKDELKPRCGDEGSDVIGPRNPNRERQEPDLISPPSTDAGKLANMKWSFADSHMRLEDGGWTRETIVRELPTSTELVSVNMRLEEGAYRELHWHTEAEWACKCYEGTQLENTTDDDFPAGVDQELEKEV